MNTLSLFIYLADVSFSLCLLFIFLGCISAIACCIWCGCACERLAKQERKGEGNFKFPKGSVWTLALVAVFFWISSALLPSKEAMYLIAGSQIGEAVVTSPEAKELYQDIKTVIKQQITEKVQLE